MADKHRGHNEGSVYFDKSRDQWVVAITMSPGKRKKFYFEKKADALRKKNEALRELEQGTLPTGNQRKLGEFIENWLENVHKENLRISPYVKYKKLVRYIVAGLGEVWLQKLTPLQVQQFYAKKRKDGLSSKTVHEIHGVLHLALKHAVRWNYISRNVCELVDSPRVVSRKGTPLSVEQAKKLVESLKGHRLELVVLTAIITGARRGEILALRWSDVDMERRVLHILRTVDYIHPYGYVENEPKTKSGKRLIDLPEFYLALLKKYKVKQERQRRKVGDKWENRDLVFADMTGGYLSPSHLNDDFGKLVEDAGLPHIPFHDLRRSAATILLSMGIHPKVIQELLGHSDISITLGIYGHLFPTMGQGVAQKWDGVFGEQ